MSFITYFQVELLYLRMLKNKRMNSTLYVAERFDTVSRSELREILLARMAGGDLYASEIYRKVREADIILDMLRDKPIYIKNGSK